MRTNQTDTAYKKIINREKLCANLMSYTGLGYIQLSPVVFTLPHMYSCPPTPVQAENADPAATTAVGGTTFCR